MYNVLEALRAGRELTAKEKPIHTQGLVSVLKELHDELDAAVLAAYGLAGVPQADWLQRLAVGDRREREFREQLTGLNEELEQLKQELAVAMRVTLAQSEAIKKWPVLWLEEVEKALDQNPNRRRQPALVPVRED